MPSHVEANWISSICLFLNILCSKERQIDEITVLPVQLLATIKRKKYDNFRGSKFSILKIQIITLRDIPRGVGQMMLLIFEITPQQNHQIL